MISPEEWRDIPGWEGRYFVSNHGRVLSKVTDRIFKPSVSHSGYESITLQDKSRSLMKQPMIHKIVALVFLGPRPEGQQINHKDGNKRNNAADNLEYVTPRQNVRHSFALGRVPYRPKWYEIAESRLNPDLVRDLRQRFTNGESCRSMALQLGVMPCTIWNAVHRKTWKHVA